MNSLKKLLFTNFLPTLWIKVRYNFKSICCIVTPKIIWHSCVHITKGKVLLSDDLKKKKWQHKGWTSSFILYWLQLPTTAVYKWNKNKQFSNLVYSSNGLKKARPGSSLAFQTKIALSSDQAGQLCSFSRIFLSQSGSISSSKFVPFLPVYYYMSVAPVK